MFNLYVFHRNGGGRYRFLDRAAAERTHAAVLEAIILGVDVEFEHYGSKVFFRASAVIGCALDDMEARTPHDLACDAAEAAHSKRYEKAAQDAEPDSETGIRPN